MNWTDLNGAIAANDTFLFSSHLSLDGDCIGSQLAFMWYLESLGKKTYCYCADPLPQNMAFLKGSERITQVKPAETFDVLMALDCSSLSRIGWEVSESDAKAIVNIDHHRDNKNFGAINYVDSGAAATGEIVYGFFMDNGVGIPLHVAEHLYAAIMTDTGGFRFSNTSGNVLRVCSELADIGVSASMMYENIYESHPRRALALRARIWSTLKFYLDGRVCGMDMPMSALDELGALYSDAEGMVDNTVTALGVEVGIMTKHTPEETHVSLRSKGKIDVGRIAQSVSGGGGHNCAAGCTLKMPYGRAMEHMLSVLEKELRDAGC